MIEPTKRKKVKQVLKKLFIIVSNHTQVKTKMKYQHRPTRIAETEENGNAKY